MGSIHRGADPRLVHDARIDHQHVVEFRADGVVGARGFPRKLAAVVVGGRGRAGGGDGGDWETGGRGEGGG